MKIRLTLALLLAPIFVCGATQHAQVAYPDLGDGASPITIAADSSGNLFIVSYVTEPSGRHQIRVTKTDPKGNTQAHLDFGGSAAGFVLSDTIGGAAVDASGNVVIAGTAESADFPLVSPLTANASRNSAFIIKIDSGLQTILFSTLLGGAKGYTLAQAIALDKASNIYVTGLTSATDFPVTAGAFQTKPPTGRAEYAYLTEVSADGKKIVFSTYFGDGNFICTGTSCGGLSASTSASAIALDAAGNVVIGGTTTANRLPIPAGVYEQKCGDCGNSRSAGFLAKFTSGGSNLLWATYIPITAPSPAYGSIGINSIALDSAGNVVAGGNVFSTAPKPLPITPGVLQPVAPLVQKNFVSAGFVAKFDSTAERLLFSTYFGGADGERGLALDSSGAIWVTGTSPTADLPAPQGTLLLGPTYVAALSSDGSALTNILTAPNGAAGQAMVLTGAGTIALGYGGSLLTVSSGSQPSLVGIENAASGSVSGAVAPFELVSLYGIDIGPSTAMQPSVVNGVVTSSSGGVQALFGGVPAPLLLAGPNQINAIVPGEVYGLDNVALQIVTPSGTIDGPLISVRPSQPGVFVQPPVANSTSSVQAVASNQDGSVNSAANPAPLGSIVTVWATGTGRSSVFYSDGTILPSTYGAPTLPVSVFASPLLLGGSPYLALGSVGGLPGPLSLEVLYAGDAIGLVEGVQQVNFRLPAQVDYIPHTGFQLRIGDASSNGFILYLKP
jgi:uncharacterized protein (TIGR03437 family)